MTDTTKTAGQVLWEALHPDRGEGSILRTWHDSTTQREKDFARDAASAVIAHHEAAISKMETTEVASLREQLATMRRCECSDDEACAHVRRALNAETRVEELTTQLAERRVVVPELTDSLFHSIRNMLHNVPDPSWIGKRSAERLVDLIASSFRALDPATECVVGRERITRLSQAIDDLVVVSDHPNGSIQDKAVSVLCMAFQPLFKALRSQQEGAR